MQANPSKHPVIFFDGYCGLCTRSVQFILKNDRKNVFRFASLQSAFAANTLPPDTETNTFVLMDGGRLYTRSDAAIRTLQKLGGIYRCSVVLFVIPAFIRNAMYRFIANNRYRWFVRNDSCYLPTADRKDLFLDAQAN
jgi:predicted DCC family thiol-disulfide oxidoreductase YuxK